MSVAQNVVMTHLDADTLANLSADAERAEAAVLEPVQRALDDGLGSEHGGFEPKR
jgi:hypothetical protein